jgi:hypothetical protein
MRATFITGKFPTGRVVITSGAHAVLSEVDVFDALLRHASGDWGELCEQDWRQNDEALEYGSRLLSRYCSTAGTTFWIITEHDRSVTTVLLPEEY